MFKSASSVSLSRASSNIASSFRRVFVLAALALPVGIVSQPVEARTVAAAVGAVAPWDSHCLSYWYGTVTNACDYTISFDWPLPVDSGGNKRVGVQRVNTSDRSAALAIKMAAAATTAAATAATSEYAPSAPVEQKRPKLTLTREEMHSRLNDRFAAEPADLGWSNPAHALLESHLQAGLPDGSRLVSVECHRTMCRVEAQHSSLDVYNRFVDKALLFRDGGWNGSVMTEILNPGDAQVSSVAYLLRGGADFASVLE